MPHPPLLAGQIPCTTLSAALGGEQARYDGHKGKSLSFRMWDHQLRQPLYVRTTSGVASEIEELPLSSSGQFSTTESLDLLGGTDHTRCTWSQ